MSNEPDRGAPEDSGPSFAEFPVPSYDDWRSEAERILKGVPFEKRLVTRTYEGIDLQPMYQASDTQGLAHMDSLPGFPPFVRSADVLGYRTKSWEVCQELPFATAAEFNAAAQSDLERGQTTLNMKLDVPTRLARDADSSDAGDVGRGGTSISCMEDLNKALHNIDVERTSLFVSAGVATLPLLALLTAYLRQHVKAPEKLRGTLGMDPLGTLAEQGTISVAVDDAYEQMAAATRWAAESAPQLATVLAAGHPYHNGGASATQELGFVLATAAEYLRALGERGVSVEQAAPRIRFGLSIGSNFFMEIARLRAARALWAKVVGEFGGSADAQKPFIHAGTSRWNKTLYDPYVNMLRTTTEAFSAVVGGCDSLHVGPFDEVIREPDEFSRRIARNTHTILREECHVPRAIDPAGGSWYVEWLTDAIARASWDVFRDVEKQGGMLKALHAGAPQAQVRDVSAKRAAGAAQRRDVVVGTNMYANANERPLDRRIPDYEALRSRRTEELAGYRQSADGDWRDSALRKLAEASPDKLFEAAVHAADGGATLGEIGAALRGSGSPPASVEPIRAGRGAEQYEALRDAAAQYAERSGGRPRAFLANLGPLAQHKARADFSRGFLEVGGFEVIDKGGYPDAASAAQAVAESEAPVAVICSTDNSYPDLVPPLAKAIKENKPETVVLLAGYPPDHVEAFRQSGVDDFIHLRANCHQLLSSLQQKIGVQQ